MKKHFYSILLIFILLAVSAASAAGLDVYFLDVGQGNSAVITSGNYTMMVDGGPKEASDYIHAFLKKKGIERIDYMVATHMDADHVGGLLAALQYASVGIVFSNEETPSYDSLKKYLNKQKIHIPYMIVYNLNGGVNAEANPATYTIAQTVKLVTPTREGYVFAGWYTNAKCTTKFTYIKKGSTGTKAVYAKWKPLA